MELGWLTLKQTTFKNNFCLNVISIELLATISAVDVNKICLWFYWQDFSVCVSLITLLSLGVSQACPAMIVPTLKKDRFVSSQICFLVDFLL